MAGADPLAGRTSTDQDTTVDWAIAGPLRRWEVTKPGAPCISFEGRTATWREVFERSCRVAQMVRSVGLEVQDRVMWLGRNRPEFFEVLMGVSMAGGVTGAVNWRLSPREMLLILNHTQGKVLVVEDTFLAQLDEIREELTSIETIVVVGPGRDAGERRDLDYESMLAGQPAEDPGVVVGPEDTGLQMYTSGTSGLPKGAMFSNRALRSNRAMAELTRVDEASVVLVAMPVFHASGSSLGMLAFQSGAHVVIAPEVVPADLLALVGEYRVTMTTLVPAVLKMMVECPAIADADLSSLATVVYVASPISPELLRASLAAFGCRFLQIYGLTETNGVTALLPEDHLDPEHPERMLSAGRAMEGSEVRIIDPITGEPVGEGEFGEVCLKAPTSMSGYFPAGQQAPALDAEGWLRTGDGGYLRDGYLYLKDRIKDMIITGGENVYPVEVENVLVEDPRINDVAVIGVPSDRWGETVKAIVVLEAGATSLTSDEVIAFARGRLARYKTPTSVEFTGEIPRNPAGKILKRVLRERHTS